MISLLWFAVGFELLALAVLFWMLRRSQSTQADSIECVEDKINSSFNDLRVSLSAYKLEVAKSYASIALARDIERRLTDLIDRKKAERPVARPDDERFLHVVPCFGREHRASLDCWCHPRPDSEEPNVIIHHPEQ